MTLQYTKIVYCKIISYKKLNKICYWSLYFDTFI